VTAALKVVLISALLAGCAPVTQKMSDADRKAVRVANINPNVTKPPEPYYLGPGGGIGLAFGALGAIVTEPGRAAGRSSLAEFLDRNGVSIERIALEELGAALRASGKLQIADRAEPGAATISIVIKLYGLSIPHGFSSNLVPVLQMECAMVDAGGKTVWSAGDRLLSLGNPVEARPAEELRNDARAIENGLRAAARHIAGNIAKEL